MIKYLGSFPLFGNNCLRENHTDLLKRRILDSLIPDCCWVKVIGNITLDDLQAVLDVGNVSQMIPLGAMLSTTDLLMCFRTDAMTNSFGF